MEINLLGADEIKYELTLRGLPITGSFPHKRALLRDAMRMEREGSVSRPTTSYLQSETDICVCQAKLYILERDILNFDYNNKDGEFRRIQTFLLHVEARLHRIQASQQSEVDQQNKLIDKCQQLIGNLHSALEGIPRTLIRDQDVSSVPGASAQENVYLRPENLSILDLENEPIENNILPSTIAPQERTQVSYDLIDIDAAPLASILGHPVQQLPPSMTQRGSTHPNDPQPDLNASRHSAVVSSLHPQTVYHGNVSSYPNIPEGEEINRNPLASSTDQRSTDFSNRNEYVEQRRIIHAPTRVSLGTFSTGTLPTSREEQSNFPARRINFDVSQGTRMATNGSELHVVDLSNSSGRHISGPQALHSEPIDLTTVHEPIHEFSQSAARQVAEPQSWKSVNANPLASVPLSRQNLYLNQARNAQIDSRLRLSTQPVQTNLPRSQLAEPRRILSSQPNLTNLARTHAYQVHSSEHYSGRTQPVSEYTRETSQTINMPTAFSSERQSSQVHFADQQKDTSRFVNVNSTRREEPVNYSDPYVDLADRLDNFQFSPLRGTSGEEPRICSSSSRFLDIGKWNVKFNGQSSVNDFLERIEELRVSRGATKEQLLRSAPELFCGDALLWFRTCNVVSWDDLVSQLRDTFQPYDYEFALWDEIRRRTQGAQERVISFVASMENLFRKLPVMPSETTRLQMIRRNLLPYIQSRLSTHQILSLQDLVRLSRAVEETESRIQRFVPPSTNYRQLIEPALAYHKPSNYVSAVESSPVSPVSEIRTPTSSVLCWNCQEVDHQFRQCTKPLPAKVIWAITGLDAELPCDVTPALPQDNVTMIFWFKDTIGMPLYSLDARGGPLSEALQLAMSDDLGRRSYFIVDEEPSKARLRIQHVNEGDQGVFRCRVDFVNSPTRNFQVNLTLVDQPSRPRIFDAEGREVKLNATAGPFLEGHELFLSCQVNGGRPRPTLTWWYNNMILDSVVDSNRGSQTTVNQLLITSVGRNLKGGQLECRASSSDVAGDIVREVPITVFLKPSKVKIVTPNDLLSISKSQTIRCETSGSYPPAKLTWMLDWKPIRNAVITEEETSSFTGSILTLTVSAEDDGKILVCRADNPRFPGGSEQDKRRISVAYPPRVSVALNFGTVTPVHEGTDVILHCETLARPKAHSYYWYHDRLNMDHDYCKPSTSGVSKEDSNSAHLQIHGNKLAQEMIRNVYRYFIEQHEDLSPLQNHLVAYNESGGLLPNQDVLTIKNIRQKSAGQYACSARNSEGETYSSPFDLTVQYAPRCKKGHEQVRVGIMAFDSIFAQCTVSAIPPVNKFSWTFNTSKDVMPVQGAKIQSKGNTSILNFSSVPNDLKSLSCWAENDVGRQETPCLFYIVPAEPPESPKGCIIRNASHGGLEVSCIAGQDGGLHQSFVLEVSDLSGPAPPGIHSTLNDQGDGISPAFRVLGERPVFRLLNLKPNREYQVVVYAENARGRSDPPVMLPSIQVKHETSFETLQEDDTHTVYEISNIPSSKRPLGSSSNQSLTIIIAGVSAIAVLLIVVVVVAATVIACKKSSATSGVKRRGRRRSKPPSDLELSEAGFGEGFHRRSAMYRASMYGECEERISRLIEGPDLILAPTSFSPQNSDY